MREKTMKTSPGNQDGKRALTLGTFSVEKSGFCCFRVENITLRLMNNNFETLCTVIPVFVKF